MARPVPLPQYLPPSLGASQSILQIRTAYLIIFELNQRVANIGDADLDIRGDWLVRIRVLGHLIPEALSFLATSSGEN
jgi:hypothetical protein